MGKRHGKAPQEFGVEYGRNASDTWEYEVKIFMHINEFS